jgi:hypothetical protein
MGAAMPDRPPSEVLGGLPKSRPHRRSDKRGARPTPAPAEQAAAGRAERAPAATGAKPAAKPAAAKRTPGAKPRRRPRPDTLRQPAQPVGTPSGARAQRKPAPVTGVDIVGTAVQAAAELAEIGLSVSARALRNAIARLPRP